MLILVYGVPKSASTFATEIARAIAESDGHDQISLRDRHLPGPDKSGFIADLSVLGAIADSLPEESLLVLKTHSPRNAVVESLESRGSLRCIVTYRDARDAALSAFEAAERAREQGSAAQGFVKLQTLDEAIDYILDHLDDVARKWLSTPGCLKLQYEYLTQSSDSAASDIAAHVGVDPAQIADAVRPLTTGATRVYNFNIGQSGRYETVFSPEQAAKAEHRAEDYIRFCAGEPNALRQVPEKSPLLLLGRQLRDVPHYESVSRKIRSWLMRLRPTGRNGHH